MTPLPPLLTHARLNRQPAMCACLDVKDSTQNAALKAIQAKQEILAHVVFQTGKLLFNRERFAATRRAETYGGNGDGSDFLLFLRPFTLVLGPTLLQFLFLTERMTCILPIVT